MKPWLVYVRVSTEDQAREGCSPEVQQDACAAMLKALGHKKGETIEDLGRSGKDLNREGVQRVLAVVEQSAAAGVIVYKLDRLTRNVEDLYRLMRLFQERNVTLLAVRDMIDTSTATGRMCIGFLGVIAQWYRENVSELVTAGMRHRKAQGGFVGGRTPAGLLVQGEVGKRELLVHPKQGPIVAQVWIQISQGKTLRQVAEYLTKAKIPSTSLGWTPNGVRKVAISKRYIGLLVSKEVQDLAISVLQGRAAPGRGGRPMKTQTHSTRDWLLSGIGKCGECGSTLIGVSATSHVGKAYRYYRCTGRVRYGKKHCQASDVRAEPWEAAVIDVLIRAVREDGRLAPRVRDYAKQARAALGDLEAQRKKLAMARDRQAAEVARLVEMAATGGMVASAIAGPLAERQTKLDALNLELAGVDGQAAAASITADQAEAIVDMIRRKIDTLAEAPPDEQAEILQSLLASATLKRNASDKTTGEVDLSINLPRLAGAGFVYPSPMVDHGSRRLNLVHIHDNVVLLRQIT